MALPPELIIRIVEIVNDTVADEVQQRSNCYALRLVSRLISQCSQDVMLTTCFSHLRILSLKSLIDITTAHQALVAKIRKITIAVVAPKWTERPPPSALDESTMTLPLDFETNGRQWLYSGLVAQCRHTRYLGGPIFEALDKALLNLKTLDSHVELRVTCCEIPVNLPRKDDTSRDTPRVTAMLKACIGGPRVAYLRSCDRERDPGPFITANRPAFAAQAASLLLCALARTEYSPRALDLDFSDHGETASVPSGDYLPRSLSYPFMPYLTTLKVEFSQVTYWDVGYNDWNHDAPECITGFAKWLTVMPSLQDLSLRFGHSIDISIDTENVDLSDTHTTELQTLVDSLRHI
ncbi:hypothetical protein LTR95_006584 [Oleoguttula sp. CCFEE 5521]